jgi:glycerol-3-phosphate dehydrogenase (NAD(P)+)
MDALVQKTRETAGRNPSPSYGIIDSQSVKTIAASMRMVAEGVKTTEAVCDLAERMGVELPLAFAVRRVLGGTAPLDALRALMSRALREE